MDRVLTLAALAVLTLAVVIGPGASFLPDAAGGGSVDAATPGNGSPVPQVGPPWASSTPTSCEPLYGPLPTIRDNVSSTTVVFVHAGSELTRATLEVADQPAEWETGLMNRTSLDPDGGMLFVFPEEERRTFWMKDTLVALDIIYVTDKGVVVGSSQALPEPGVADEDLRRYNSGERVQYVVEVPAGTVDAAGIKTGTQLYVVSDAGCGGRN